MKLINKGEFVIFEALDNKVCLELNGASIFLTDKQLAKLGINQQNVREKAQNKLMWEIND